MSQLLYFKLPKCPYCKQTDKWIEELKRENTEYDNIEITIIDESKDKEISNKYDYYYVPSFFFGDIKLHEGVASKEKVRSIFDKVLKKKLK